MFDIQETAGTRQLCAGQSVGVEAAIHGVRVVFHRDNSEATQLVDASNAFNSLNCIVALHSIRHLCPSLATFLINTYRSPSALYVMGDTLASEEGTTNGYAYVCPGHTSLD